MAGIGEILRTARQEKGLSLKEAEEATKIRLKYLHALENESFRELPGRVYAIGFLRTYARYLGLDPEEMLRQFKAEASMPAEAPTATLTRSGDARGQSRRWQRLLVVLLVVAALVGYNRLYLASRAPEKPPSMPPPAPFAPPEKQVLPPQPKEEPKPAPVITGVELKVTVQERECWVGVRIDGGRQQDLGNLKKGDSRTFKADREIELALGSAGVAEVTYNGKVQPRLGAPGEVVRKLYKAEIPAGGKAQ